MGKARDIADAEQQVQDEAWQCKTCSSPANGDDNFCEPCRSYWKDCEQFGYY